MKVKGFKSLGEIFPQAPRHPATVNYRHCHYKTAPLKVEGERGEPKQPCIKEEAPRATQKLHFLFGYARPLTPP